MMAGGLRAARVRVDFSQYQVAAGDDLRVGDGGVPGLLGDMGPQGVAVTTGCPAGSVAVTALAVAAVPAGVEPGWDVVAETDLECPEGAISVLDWGGPDHPELGDLAIAGPGRYRLRVHARHREDTGSKRSAEQHHLLIWPVAEPEPPRLLTAMDAHGRLICGGGDDGPPLDAVEQAAADAVRQLARLVARPGPPALSGELTVARVQATVPATGRRVWNQVSTPWNWVAIGGSINPADFDLKLQRDPELHVRGAVIVDESPSRVAYTWSWTTTRWERVERRMPTEVMSKDLVTGEIIAVTRMEWVDELAGSWMLPPEPSTVHIGIRRADKGVTAIELEHRDLPVELAAYVQPFWEWALRRELPRDLAKAPFYGFPWNRGGR